MLSPSPSATDGATRATRREAGATGFDCRAGASTASPHRPGDRAYLINRSGVLALLLPAWTRQRDERRMTVTSRRQDWAARRRGELNRERGSCRLSPAINAPRRLTEGRPGGAWTKAGSAESQADPIGHLCPVCGSLLEPSGDLGETV